MSVVWDHLTVLYTGILFKWSGFHKALKRNHLAERHDLGCYLSAYLAWHLRKPRRGQHVIKNICEQNFVTVHWPSSNRILSFDIMSRDLEMSHRFSPHFSNYWPRWFALDSGDTVDTSLHSNDQVIMTTLGIMIRCDIGSDSHMWNMSQKLSIECMNEVIQESDRSNSPIIVMSE